MIADLEHFGESLWRNEEVDEKRFNFFLTLVTAAIAGLVAVHTEGKGQLDASMVRDITSAALVRLLGLDLLTYLRMFQRNRVTDQYQRTLKHIRDKLLAINPLGEGYRVAQPLDTGKWKWFKGGLAETIGAIDAVLLCALLIINSVSPVWVGAVSLLVLIFSRVLAAPRKGVS